MPLSKEEIGEYVGIKVKVKVTSPFFSYYFNSEDTTIEIIIIVSR